jgi:hypothetical protein
MKKIYLLTLSLVVFFQGIAQNRISFSEKKANEFDLSKNFKSYKILEIDDKLQRISDGEEIIISLDKQYVFELKENKILSDNYIVSTKSKDGIERKNLDEIGFDGKYFVNNDIASNNQLAFSMFEDRYSFYIKNESKEFYIEPLKNFDKTASSNLYVYYQVEDIIQENDYSCGLKNEEHKSEIYSTLERNTTTGVCKSVDINFAVDYTMFATYGSVNGAINRTLELINLSQVNYTIVNGLSDDVFFKVNEHFIVTCNTCNNWDPTLEIYDNYNNFSWNAYQMFINPYDIKVLFQNQGGTGSVIGLGSLTMCNNYGIAVVKNYPLNSDYTRNILSHELGHNFGCQHTSGYIMNPSINSTNNWAPESITVINNSLNTLSCISNCTSSPCSNKKVSDAVVTIDANSGIINVSWLAETGISFKVRLYNYYTNSWSSYTTVNYPANSAFFVYSQLHCNDKYRVEIVPVCSGINGISEQIVFNISQNAAAPYLSQIFGASEPLCSGKMAYFSITSIDGGAAPVYQWKINGFNIGTNAPNLSTNVLQNNDVISCQLTSNATCVNNPIATSSAIVTVTVPTVLSVAIEASNTTICAGDTVSLNATGTNIISLYPFYSWTFNGNYIQGGPTGQQSGPIVTHTPTESGIYVCTLYDGESCHTVEGGAISNPIYVTVLPQPCNLVNNNFEISGLNYYPNPVENVLHVSANEMISSIEIFTIIGQKIESKKINLEKATLDLSTLSNGTYFVKVEANGKMKNIKVIKE